MVDSPLPFESIQDQLPPAAARSLTDADFAWTLAADQTVTF
jgi:hypothetical protein